MLFNFSINGTEYEMDLPPDLRVDIARDLMSLHEKYLIANPNENISFNDYLTLVKNAPIPKDEVIPNDSENEEEFTDVEIGSELERMRTKTLIIDGLIAIITKLNE